MLKIKLLVLIFIALATEQKLLNAQKIIKGNGYILTQQRPVPPFNNIEVSHNISVYITQGAFQPLTVEADNNLFNYIKTEVKNNTLKIYSDTLVVIKKYGVMNVIISMPSIHKLEATHTARIEGFQQPWKTDNIDLKITGNSKIKLHIATQNIQIDATTASLVELKGTTEKLNANLSTTAHLKAKELQAKTANITANTSATAEIEVSKELTYQLTSGARLTYKGNPQILQTNVSDGAKVSHQN